jgi:hypothetical protein
MKLHANARTCPKSRRLPADRLEGGWSLRSSAEAAGVSERTPPSGSAVDATKVRRVWRIAARHRGGCHHDCRPTGSRRSRRCGGCG